MFEAARQRLEHTPGLGAGTLARVQGLCVGFIGAGALGGQSIKDCALLEIPMRICDLDRVSIENLGNSGFEARQVGAWKSEARAEQVRAWNPDCPVEAVPKPLEELGLAAFGDCALLVGSPDNRPARACIDEISRALGTPWLDLAVSGDGVSLFGTVTLYDPRHPDGACYRCSHDAASLGELMREARGPGCPSWRGAGAVASAPTLQGSAFSTLVGAQGSLVALQVLQGASHELVNRRLLIVCDPLPRVEVLELVRNPRCVARHAPLVPLREAPGETVGSLLEAARADLGGPPDALQLHQRTLVHGLVCVDCGARRELVRVAGAVRDAELRCACGTARELLPVELLDGLQASLAERLAERSWRSLGLPSRDVVSALAGSREAHYVIDPRRGLLP